MPLRPNSHTNGVNFFLLDVFTLLPNRSNAKLLTRLIKKHTCPLPSRDPPPCSSRRPPLHPMRRGVGRAEGRPAGSESRGGWLGAQAPRVATASGDRGPRRPVGSARRGGRLGAWESRAAATGGEREARRPARSLGIEVAAACEDGGRRGPRWPAGSESYGGRLGAWASRRGGRWGRRRRGGSKPRAPSAG